MATFPVTAADQVHPSDPRDEPTRDEVNAHPENQMQRMDRTRRYFRLCRRPRPQRYARGLDSNPEDFA